MRKRQTREERLHEEYGEPRNYRGRGGTALWPAIFPLAVILNLAARLVPGFAEWYAVHIYPLIVGSLGRLCSLLPFSVSEILLYAALAALFTGLVLILERRLQLRNAAAVLAKAAALLLLIFTLNCGINYHRLTFSERAGFEIRESSVEELVMFCEQLVEELNEAAEEITVDSEGDFVLDMDVEEEAVKAMEAAAEEYPELAGYYPQAKPVLGYWLLSYQQLQGIYSPFTVEANYNGDMPDQDKPSTICHELSHLRGFMREDEANFIAYLACRASDSAAFRYSGALLAYLHSGNALYRQDPESFLRVREKLCDQAVHDLMAHNAYWNSYEGTVAEVADKVNDTYLRVNAQADGTKSYGRMVDLLLAWNRERGADNGND